MKVAQLPAETLDKVMNILAEMPFRAVAGTISLVQSQVKVLDLDPPSEPQPPS